MRIEQVETLEALRSDIRDIAGEMSKINSSINDRKVARKLLSIFRYLQEAGYTISEIVDSTQRIE